MDKTGKTSETPAKPAARSKIGGNGTGKSTTVAKKDNVPHPGFAALIFHGFILDINLI